MASFEVKLGVTTETKEGIERAAQAAARLSLAIAEVSETFSRCCEAMEQFREAMTELDIDIKVKE